MRNVLKQSKDNLYSILCSIGSQWREWSIGVTWADLAVLKMSLAALCCTFGSLETRYLLLLLFLLLLLLLFLWLLLFVCLFLLLNQSKYFVGYYFPTINSNLQYWYYTWNEHCCAFEVSGLNRNLRLVRHYWFAYFLRFKHLTRTSDGVEEVKKLYQVKYFDWLICLFHADLPVVHTHTHTHTHARTHARARPLLHVCNSDTQRYLCVTVTHNGICMWQWHNDICVTVTHNGICV